MGEKEYCEEYEKEIENSKEAKYECLVFQVLEEHVEKDKKHFEPCQDCIRLGITKGYQKAWKQALTLKLKELDEDILDLIKFQELFGVVNWEEDISEYLNDGAIKLKQKLVQKQSEREEVNRILENLK